MSSRKYTKDCEDTQEESIYYSVNSVDSGSTQYRSLSTEFEEVSLDQDTSKRTSRKSKGKGKPKLKLTSTADALLKFVNANVAFLTSINDTEDDDDVHYDDQNGDDNPGNLLDPRSREFSEKKNSTSSNKAHSERSMVSSMSSLQSESDRSSASKTKVQRPSEYLLKKVRTQCKVVESLGLCPGRGSPGATITAACSQVAGKLINHPLSSPPLNTRTPISNPSQSTTLTSDIESKKKSSSKRNLHKISHSSTGNREKDSSVSDSNGSSHLNVSLKSSKGMHNLHDGKVPPVKCSEPEDVEDPTLVSVNGMGELTLKHSFKPISKFLDSCAKRDQLCDKALHDFKKACEDLRNAFSVTYEE